MFGGLKKVWAALAELRRFESWVSEKMISVDSRVVTLEIRTASLRKLEQLRDNAEALAKAKAKTNEVMWTTQAGVTMRIRDMSSAHMRNCIDGGFVSRRSIKGRAMRAELDRRALSKPIRPPVLEPGKDFDIRTGEGCGEMSDFEEHMPMQRVGKLFGTKIYIGMEIPAEKERAVRMFFDNFYGGRTL